MRIGYCDYYSENTVAFAAGAGFDCLEISVGREAGLSLDNVNVDEIVSVFDKYKVKVGTVCCAPNHLSGGAAERKQNNREFLGFIRLCKKFGTDILTTNAWADRSKTPAENIAAYKEVFSEYAAEAESEGVKIAIENCPHAWGYPPAIGNIAFSPGMWDMLFEAVPSVSVGLEFDPSHLFWQGIDIPGSIRKYGDRIYAFHAKDTEILREELSKYGILGRSWENPSEWGTSWWRYRLPGWGQIDWKEVHKALYDINYAGPMIIEHEDPVFTGDKKKQSLVWTLNYLRSFEVL